VSLLSVSEIVELLAAQYGETVRMKHRDPLSELILTILSQNTSDHNSRRAFGNLLEEFGDWRSVAGAAVEEIESAIKTGGLSRVKAPRIKQILNQIKEQHGSYDLDFLSDMAASEAMAWLQRLHGVGPKTASCVLLFSLGKPVLPVDTHIYRVAKRLGLIGSQVPADRAHDILGGMVPDSDVYGFHIHMIEHGRRICKAHNPLCHQCVLLRVCVTGRQLP